MRAQSIAFTLVLSLLSIGVSTVGQKTKKDVRRISRASLEDKIRGGWAGQMIGVSYGAPTEFRSNGKIIETNIGNYQDWKPDRLFNSIAQDDLYVEMTFAEVMDRVGLDATSEQYGEAFKNSKYNLWHANAGARRLLNQGVKAPLSGHPKYNIHANDIDFQIESDFIGMMTPGLPQESNKYSERVGRVMNWGDGLYGGMFVTGMYAAAFFENDPRKIVEGGLATMPARSGYAQIIRDVLDWSAQHPDDWKKTWQLIQDKWDKEDSCPDGSLSPFNIDARLNGAYIALGLLYGKGEMTRTLDVSTRAGQDSDCNPSSAAGIIGVMLGYQKIPDEWKSGIAPIADKKFDYTNYSFNDIVRSTMERAFKVIRASGGTVTETEVMIPHQAAKPAKLEQWEMGIPEKSIGAKDAAWAWKGAWSEQMGGREKKEFEGMAAEAAGSEVELKFDGTAIVLIGRYSQSGGRADVYLDGKKSDMPLDAYITERTNDNALWHVYDLKPGAHTLRVVTRGDADPRAKGKRIVINRVITYRAR